MAGQQIATVLDAERTLEKTLHKVAEGTEDHNDESETYPLPYTQQMRTRRISVGQPADDTGHDEHEDATADTALPTTFRG